MGDSVGEGEDEDESSDFFSGEAVGDADFFLVDEEPELLVPVFFVVDDVEVPVAFLVVALVE